ncbi:MAG TPA: hypothetical protein VN428_05720 [Bryobacteraceae bacterium]|nr:hypothetical protein [Bryobacteraceae bacterium]
MCRLCLALIACLPAFAQAPRIASYDIDARLDPKTRGIHGRQVLTWLNDSPDEIRELQFHLYMNAFRNERSTVMREAGGWLAERLKERNEWGWIDVKSIRIENGPDLRKAIRYIQPDDGNKDDQTVMAVTLPQPVKPGAAIRIAMDFFTKLPRGVRRTGWHGDYYFVAQWFPKIGVWEKAGERYSTQGRWNCHQFHLNSEFYFDFGDYNVNLTVPAGYAPARAASSNRAATTRRRRRQLTGSRRRAYTISRGRRRLSSSGWSGCSIRLRRFRRAN